MRPNKPTADQKVAYSLALSVLSLVLSGLALWYASVSPADLKASLGGNITFVWAGGDTVPPPSGPHWSRAGMMILAAVTAANNGAKIGEIKALFLRLHDDGDGTDWVFEPWLVISDEEKFRERFGVERTEKIWTEAISSNFHSIILPGRQTTSQSYLFRSDPGFSTNIVLGSPHHFRATLYSLSSTDSELRAQDIGTVNLTPLAIGGLTSNGAILVPFEEISKTAEKAFGKQTAK